MLKKESEKDVAHRVFKFYKATGELPPELSGLECYRLLSKYNYFIARDLDKKSINTLTEICNILDKEKILIVYGDFLLETLFFGLRNYKFAGNREVKLIYVDCNNEDPAEVISNATMTSSHFNKNIIYILDNIEQLSVKQAGYIYELDKYLHSSNKSVICCCLNPAKVVPILKLLKKIQLGSYNNEQDSIKRYMYCLFNYEDRRKAIEMIREMDYSLQYLIGLATFNLPTYFEKEPAKIDHNLQVLQSVNTLLFKADSDLLLNYLVVAFQTCSNKRVIRFPPKKEESTPIIKTNITSDVKLRNYVNGKPVKTKIQITNNSKKGGLLKQ